MLNVSILVIINITSTFYILPRNMLSFSMLQYPFVVCVYILHISSCICTPHFAGVPLRTMFENKKHQFLIFNPLPDIQHKGHEHGCIT